jgi:DUF2934 family protein
VDTKNTLLLLDEEPFRGARYRSLEWLGDHPVIPFEIGQQAMAGNAPTRALVIPFPLVIMKNHHPNDPLRPDTRNRINEIIAARAYEIWEKRGRRENEALDNWLQAERELVTGRRPQRTTAQSRLSF